VKQQLLQWGSRGRPLPFDGNLVFIMKFPTKNCKCFDRKKTSFTRRGSSALSLVWQTILWQQQKIIQFVKTHYVINSKPICWPHANKAPIANLIISMRKHREGSAGIKHISNFVRNLNCSKSLSSRILIWMISRICKNKTLIHEYQVALGEIIKPISERMNGGVWRCHALLYWQHLPRLFSVFMRYIGVLTFGWLPISLKKVLFYRLLFLAYKPLNVKNVKFK